MYYNHNLRTSLQEWKNRIYRANYQQFGNQMKYFITNLENEKVLKSILTEICSKYVYDNARIEREIDYTQRSRKISFENEMDQAAFNFQLLNYVLQKHGADKIQNISIMQRRTFEETKENIIEEYVSPLVYFLHDKLEKSNSTIYLLEKYKKRTEWFTKNNLLEKYNAAESNYEQILEDDLRMFLFDQGIDYPFSTPKSTSGRADIIGSIDTSEPLIAEIKIFDKTKGYGKSRIKAGFTQILNYTNDYNKDFGYLIIFNLDNIEINFKLPESDNIFPPRYTFNNKNYYFIVINLSQTESASKLGKIESIEITESDLIK